MNNAGVGHTPTLLTAGTVLVAGVVSGGAVLFNPLASADLYDPTTGTWSATGSMNISRWTPMATLLTDETVLVAGGSHFDNPVWNPLASAELYDPTTGTWSATGSMNNAHSGPATLLADGRVLVAGCCAPRGENSENDASAEIYDPITHTWSPTGRMTIAREGYTATLLRDGTVLAAGGGYLTFFSSPCCGSSWVD